MGTDSKNITQHPDGSSSFSVLSGSKDHFVVYEFKRDKEGQYYFVIHNREPALNQKVHGSNKFEMNNKTYGKTTVEIKVDIGMIQDENFLRGTILKQTDMKKSYQTIEAHLLNKGGIILESDLEKEIVVLRKQRDAEIKPLQEKHYKAGELVLNRRNQAKPDREALKAANEAERKVRSELENINAKWHKIITDKQKELIHDPHFHSLQTFGTCSESCLTGPEKQMAGEETRKKLKLHSMNSLVGQLKKTKFSNPTQRAQADLIIHTLSPIRIKELEEKLA